MIRTCIGRSLNRRAPGAEVQENSVGAGLVKNFVVTAEPPLQLKTFFPSAFVLNSWEMFS